MNTNAAKIFLALGLAFLLLGILIYFFHDRLRWIGNLPGDIRIDRRNFHLYMPITTMLLISIVLSIILYIWRSLR